MTSRLQAELRMALASIGTSAPIFLATAGVDRLFEGFVLSCLIRALIKNGARLEIYDGRINPSPSRTLNLRRAPGRIYDDIPGIGFIMVEFEGRFFEIHTDLRVSPANESRPRNTSKRAERIEAS